MKYIQSFYQYPVTFSAIGKTVPSKDAEGELRNIAEFTDDEISKLEAQEPLYRSLINEKKYRLLNKLPESYKPAATLVNEAREEARKVKAELEALKAEREAETKKEVKPKNTKKA
jgi:hypothetical protein